MLRLRVSPVVAQIYMFPMHSVTSPAQTPLVYIFLQEIKLRAMYGALALVITFCVSYTYADDLLYWLIAPNKEIQSHFIFLNIPEALYTTLKISGFVTLCTCMPILWYHLWGFFIPSCTRSERKQVLQVSILFFFFFLMSVWWTLYKGTPMLTKFLLQFQIHQDAFSIAYQATPQLVHLMDCLVLGYYPSYGPASNPALYCRPLEENHTYDHSTLPQGVISRMYSRRSTGVSTRSDAPADNRRRFLRLRRGDPLGSFCIYRLSQGVTGCLKRFK